MASWPAIKHHLRGNIMSQSSCVPSPYSFYLNVNFIAVLNILFGLIYIILTIWIPLRWCMFVLCPAISSADVCLSICMKSSLNGSMLSPVYLLHLSCYMTEFQSSCIWWSVNSGNGCWHLYLMIISSKWDKGIRISCPTFLILGVRFSSNFAPLKRFWSACITVSVLKTWAQCLNRLSW